MSDTINTKVEGLKELADKLRAMGPDMSRKVLPAAVGSAARLVRDEARRRNPDLSGLTEKSIYAKKIREKSGAHQATYFVGVRGGKRGAWYWRFVEFGTSRAPAYPFLRPAFAAKQQEALALIRKRIASRIKAYERART